MDNIFNKLVDKINSALKAPIIPQQQQQPQSSSDGNGGSEQFVETGTELLDDSSSKSSAAALLVSPPRVLVLRSCTSRGRKILFDSYHVTDDGEYSRQTDGKFLKETIAEFAFGSVSIATNHTARFTKINNNNHQQQLIWANVFSTKQTNSDNNNTRVSSSATSSSSGYYSSLPLLTKTGNRGPTTLSLPLSNHSENSRTYYLSCVIIVTTIHSLSSVVTPQSLSLPLEMSLATLKSLTLRTYTRLKSFPVTLKAFANCLHSDILNLFNHTHLKSIATTNVSLTTVLFPSQKSLTPELISFLIANPEAHVVIATRKMDYNKFEAFFTIADIIRKHFKDRKQVSFHDHDSGVCLSNSSPASSFTNSFSSHGNILSTSIDSSSSSSSSINSEEEEVAAAVAATTKTKSFYLGEEDNNDEEQHFALGDVDINKLYQQQQQQQQQRSCLPQQPPPMMIPVPLTLLLESTPPPPVVKQSSPHYHINTSKRYVPFHRYQVILSQQSPSYDTSHLAVTTHSIVEINPDTSTIKTFNGTTSSSSSSVIPQIRSLLDKTLSLSRTMSNNETNLFFNINLTQQILNKVT